MKKTNILLVAILLFFSGCKKDDNPVGPGDGNSDDKIEIGPMIDVRTETIGTGGGTIKISGGSLDGMEIVIPPNSFPDSKTFTISSAEVKSHQFGEYFNPISPLIKISYEGGYADELVNVKVPVKVPKGYFAMGFFYDENTGTLEGLPLLALDSTSVTLCTRHFSTSTLHGRSLKSFLKGNDQTFSNIIISYIAESILFEQPVVSTGYKLKEDEWEFPNYGSYIAAGGHCAGQSITSMWYYCEKKLNGAPDLYGQYDEVEKIWMDNPKGYRFASTIQEDINWNGKLYNLFEQIELKPSYHYLSWRAFAYTMLILEEPQFAGLTSSDGGHAIVAYKISINDSTLYVADPNFPGEIRTIKYQNGKFQPYSSKQNAQETNDKSYTGIGYYATSAMIDWDKIGNRWNELENGIIGNDRFPPYQLLRFTGTWQKLLDSVHTNEQTVYIVCQSAQCQQCLPGTGDVQLLYIYNHKGDLIAAGDTLRKGVASINLKPGWNKLGFEIMGARNNQGDNYIDFKWMNIIKDTLAIEPNPLNGEAGKEYTFTARTSGSAPASYKMVWNFGDNTPEVTVNNDSTVKHTFTSVKTFTVNVKLYNQANEKLGETSVKANITASASTIVKILAASQDGAPILTSGKVNTEYIFIGRINGTAPNPYKMEWTFGDNTPAVTVNNDSTVKHTYTSTGEFSIRLQLYNEANELLAEDTAIADINAQYFQINRVKPDYGLWGDTVDISGSGFGNAQGLNNVVFKTERTASAILWSDTLIKVIVPDGSENGGILVSIGGESKSTSYFTSVGSLIDSLKSRSSIYSFFAGMFNYSNGQPSAMTIGNTYDFPFNGIAWQENTFTVEINNTAGRSTDSYKITGTFDDRGTLLKSLKWERTLIYYTDDALTEITDKWESGFTIANVPWDRAYYARGKYTMDLSRGISNHITEVYYRYEGTGLSNNITSVDWTWDYTIFELNIFNPL